MNKSLIIVVDDFSDRVFDYENTLLLDYGSYSEVEMYDNFFWNGVQTGYGTYDYQYISLLPGENQFHIVTPDLDSVNDFDNDLLSTNTFIDLYGNFAIVDTYARYSWDSQSDVTNPNHGDWVVHTICSNLDDPERTTVLCIDVDTLNGENSHLDNLFAISLYDSFSSGILTTRFESLIYKFFTAFDSRFNPSVSSNEYVLAGLSISIAGAPASFGEGLAIETFEQIGAPVFQAAPNVGQGYFDWGSNFSDVINVGAWNVDAGGDLLISSESTLSTLDIVADGYVSHESWGANFGTSFATPAVTAEWLNLLNDYLIAVEDGGAGLSGDVTDFDYSTLMDTLIRNISTEIFAETSAGYSVTVPLLTSSFEANGAFPKTVDTFPAGTGLTNSGILSASSEQVINTIPTLSSFSASIKTTSEDKAITITFADLIAKGNEADTDGTVTSFVVKAVSSGSLKINGTAWNASTNNTIDANKSAVWTPTTHSKGTLNAFTVVVKDDDGSESTTAVQAKVVVTAGKKLVGGNGHDKLTGGTSNDSLNGGKGNDVLNGGAGSDVMLGGAGDDTYYVDTSSDKVYETTSTSSTTNAGGTDLVYSSVSFNLNAYTGVKFVENLTLTGSSNINATGNSLANKITGNSKNNKLDGGSGNDVLNGGAGSDFLTGGTGSDKLYGGSDKVRDVFDFNAISESKKGSSRDKVYDFRSGIDDLDLKGIDANTKVKGDQAFKFSGTKAAANSVWYASKDVDGSTKTKDIIVYGDVNGDKTADFEIGLVGVTKLVASDFIL